MVMIKIVGIDISLNNIGICKAVIKDNRVKIDDLSLIQPPKADSQSKKQVRKNSDDLRRARWLQENLMLAIEDCQIIAVEMPFGSQSARAMASYGICVGVLASVKKPMIEVTPAEVKLAGFGIRTATKQEMIAWATDKHPEANWKMRMLKGKKVLTSDNEHMADATAAIYAGMKTEQFKTAIAMANMFKKEFDKKVA
jgi:Holliday junction resolvasome RuvABC endonuclease subunit